MPLITTGPWEVRAVKSQVRLGSIHLYPPGTFSWAAWSVHDGVCRALGAFESSREATRAVLESHTLNLGEIDIALV
jgi:hypothetical protein